MVQLRTAAHTLAGLDLPPEDVVHRLDRVAAGMPAAPFATCICAVIDLRRNSCVIDAGCETVTQALRQRGDDDLTLVLADPARVSGSR